MKTNKRLLLVFFLVSIIILLLIAQFLRPDKSSIKAPQGSSSSNFQDKTPSGNNPEEKLKVSSTNLNTPPRGVAEPIIVKFNHSFSLNDLKITLVPQVEIHTHIDSNNNQLIIEPKEIFDYASEYQLIITSSEDNKAEQNLDKDYSFTFKTLPYTGI
jgi:hypothetical protein